MARVKLDSVLQPITDAAGNAISGATVQVNGRDAGAALVYLASTGTTQLANPLTSTRGRVAGWVEEGAYDAVVTWGPQEVIEQFDIFSADDVGGYMLKARIFVSALDYGPAGTGTTIQAAIDAVSADGGGVVFIPAGVWSIATALSIPNFVCLLGEGQSTILRCSGNNYAVTFNPGNRVGVASLQIDALSTQASGGGFDFTNARFNIRIDDIYFGNNLFTSLNIRPNASSGHFDISRIKWNGAAGCTNGLLVGDGTNLVAHVKLRELLGTATTTAGMVNWMIVKNNVDTLKAKVVEFYTGTNGILVGEAASGSVTDSFFDACLVDTMTNTGLSVVKCRGVHWTNGQIQTCATGIIIGAGALGFRARGGTVQNNTGIGVSVLAGAAHWSLIDVNVNDNNTANTAGVNGVNIAAAVSHFKIALCTIGNNVLLATGHQKTGVLVTTGASDHYLVVHNEFAGNDTAGVTDGGSGSNKVVGSNI